MFTAANLSSPFNSNHIYAIIDILRDFLLWRSFMDNIQAQKEASPNRKNYAAVIGFVLALAGFVSYGLTAIPALVFSLMGVRRKKHKKLAVAGLVICLCFLFLQILFVTPMGSVPYPLNLLKYRIVCESHFWLGFDKEHMVKAQSRRTLFLIGSEGSVYFKAEQKDFYDPNEVISYAEKNGWIYGGRIHLTKEDFSQVLSGWDGVTNENLDLYQTVSEVTAYIRNRLWFKDNCTVLAFDAGNVHGIPGYVMIRHDGSEMAVYANHGVYPDPGYPLTLPPLFEKVE